MRFVKKLFAIIFLCLWCNILVAKEPRYVIGAITNTCKKTLEYVDRYPDDARDTIQLTITNFLSGLNFYHHEQRGKYMNLNHDEPEFIVSWIINYCKKKPEKDLFSAALKYFYQLPEYKE